METTNKTINLKDFELELNNDEGDLSVKITSYKGKAGYVTIPGYIQGLQVERIGMGAFKGNDKIKKITIEKGVTVIDFDAFKDCTELIEVELPDGLLEIDMCAFSKCRNLAKIRFPESVLSISYLVFEDCEKLTSVFIPKEVQDLSCDTFSGCSELKEIIVDDENLEYSTLDGILFNEAKTLLIKYPEAKKGASYIVPDTVNYIEPRAFMNCRELVTVTLPGRLCGFGLRAYTFIGSEKLEQVIAQDDNSRFITIDGVLFDKDRKTLLFYPCGKKETEYAIPAGIDRIGMEAFKSCKNLKAVTFSESLRMIEKGAFAECENLVSITLPVNLKGICGSAFTCCKQIKKVTLSRKTRIGHGAFDEGLPVEFVYID